jgi:8-oxo-dGTP pyrophosphatase MutT (NUDIX family)
VIHKNGGPYINRFDLPGGTVEPDESLFKAIHREFAEETGITIEVKYRCM